MESVGFKEWALVCEALGRGKQCILLRKGGIAEGQAGFAFRHPEFFLFPTSFHEQTAKVRIAAEVPISRPGEIEIKFMARIERSTVVTSWETALALEPWHVLHREVVQERFDYDKSPGLHVAAVRVFRLSQSWLIPEIPAYGGCRSWVDLPDQPAGLTFKPVLDEAEHRERLRAVDVILR